MTSSSPTVTVVICCYNHAPFLREALDSVADQTRPPTQLIVTDDASSDGSANLIQAWIEQEWPEAVFIRNEQNRGLPATLNDAISRATGEFVTAMASDDWMVPHRLERQIREFQEGSQQVGMVYSNMAEVDIDGVPTGQRWFDTDRMGPANTGDLFVAMIHRAFMAAPTVLIKREVLNTAGPYDESLVAEDYDMFLRLSRLAHWAYVDEPLINYRVLATSLSRGEHFRASFRPGRIRMLRKHVGVSASVDAVIVQRTAQMTESLYKEGRSARETAADLRFVTRQSSPVRRLVLLSLSSARIPWRLIAKVRRPGPKSVAGFPRRGRNANRTR